MTPTTTKPQGLLQLSPIALNEDYRKEWSISENDYCLLSISGEPVSNTLYRKGGIGKFDPNADYNMLLKHVEAEYDKEWLKKIKSERDNPKYLESQWCIIDKYGVEKVVAERFNFESMYLIDDSVLYKTRDVIYNIETGEMYGSSSNMLKSADYIFCNTAYEDKERKGVLKVHKKTGVWELFPAK